MTKNNITIDKNTLNDNEISMYLKIDLVQEKDRKLINKIKTIKYQGRKNIEPNDMYEGGLSDHYTIDFTNCLDLKGPFIDFIIETQKKIIEGNVLVKIINFFKLNNNNNLTMETLKGDIGEALLILKSIELGYGRKIIDSIREREDSLYDFYLDKNIIEVKNSSIRSKEIKINHNQIPNDNDKNIFICVANTKNLKKTCENHKSILDLYEMISKNEKLNPLLEVKKHWYETLESEIIDNNSIDINDYYFSIIPFDEIKKIKIDQFPTNVKDLIYVLDVSKYNKVSDEDLITIIK